jgi:hypothetical protein
MKVFSQRKINKKTSTSNEFSQKCRERIAYAIIDTCACNKEIIPKTLEILKKRILNRFIRIHGSTCLLTSQNDIFQYFMSSSNNEHILDIIEIALQECPLGFQKDKNDVIENINSILEEESSIFYLTKYVNEEDINNFSTPKLRLDNYSIDPQIYPTIPIEIYPIIAIKQNNLVQQICIIPMIDFLSKPSCKIPNQEMLEALEFFKKQKYDDCITRCGQSFESVLKLICDKKGYQYDNFSATATNLLKVCKDNQLFDNFYENMFISTATIRNKISSAHGKQSTTFVCTKAKAEHAIAVTAAHILLLAELSGI